MCAEEELVISFESVLGFWVLFRLLGSGCFWPVVLVDENGYGHHRVRLSLRFGRG